MKNRLEKLRALTKMALDVEMMKLQKIALAEEEKTEQISRLRAAGTKRMASLNNKGGADLALYGGADTRWAEWVQVKISNLNTQKAALVASKDEQKLHTQKAFGKDVAIRKLVEAEQEMARVNQSRPV